MLEQKLKFYIKPLFCKYGGGAGARKSKQILDISVNYVKFEL